MWSPRNEDVGQKLISRWLSSSHTTTDVEVLETSVCSGIRWSRWVDQSGHWNAAAKTVSYDFISGIAFKTRNKKDTGVIPLGKEVKVIVAPIPATILRREAWNCVRQWHRSLPISDHREIRQIAVVVQKHMELNGAFGLTEVGPGERLKQRSTVVESRLSSLFLKRNFFFLPGLSLRQKSRKWQKTLISVQDGVHWHRKRAFGGAVRKPKWLSLPQVMASPSLISRRLLAWAVGKKAWRHTDPGRETFGMSFCLAIINQP